MTVRFVQITDHHLTEDGMLWGYQTQAAFDRVLDHIAAHAGPLDFLVSTGDLTEHGAAAEYTQFLRLLDAEPAGSFPGPLTSRRLGLPCYVLPGNHDHRAQFCRSLLPATPPAERLHGSFEVGGYQFICLDYGPRGKAEADHSFYAGLAAALARKLPAVLLLHQHVRPLGIDWLDVMVADDVDRLAAQLLGADIRAILHGHTHASYSEHLAGIPSFGLRSTCFQFAPQERLLRVIESPHYRIVTLSEAGLSTELVEVPW
jgi:3',5'-cyclic-AMP phosphodiesterase